MSKKIALVTGANRGLGLEISRQLGKQGITILLASRTLAAAEVAAKGLQEEGLDVIGVQLDVTNEEHISAIFDYIDKTYGYLDILINNAGVLLEKSVDEKDAFRKTIEANTIAPYILTEILLPLLLKSDAGRIVNQSSIIGSLEVMSTNERVQEFAVPGYAASKAALNMLTVYWANQLKDTSVKVNSVHPGLVKTDMGGATADLSIVDGARSAVRLATIPDDGPNGGFFHLDKVLPW
ncbi:SDR family oxidoreductase [Paenibacillus sp. 19GGS1-52]|uniref:SDR family oxidoreductase n=1 Tax=Paenibacillus sp. 19GGS1-52 TaxID=2758563 RepID=UPI001EFAE7B5|nr:SDR family oxidoreductase [Paenibacillus sp. 19GGS1-52]ULO05049.1 SDR family oxidoreductase [Paenibacillus sp. 19GGS1-52]